MYALRAYACMIVFGFVFKKKTFLFSFFSFPLLFLSFFAPFWPFFALLCIIVLFSPLFRVYYVYHDDVPGVISLQGIRDGGIPQLVIVPLPWRYWYCDARIVIFVFFHRDLYGGLL